MNAQVRRRPLSTRLLGWLFRGAEHRIICGIRVGTAQSNAATSEAMLGKLEAALTLLRRNDPRTVAALQKATDGIFVFGTAGVCAEWWRDARLVVMQEEYVADSGTSTAAVAATLVHEATHAWLEHLGFQYTAERRARIESICFRRELRFARRLPGTSDLAATIEQQLTRSPEYLTDEAFRERTLAELRRLGVPARLVRLLVWYLRRFGRLTRTCGPPP